MDERPHDIFTHLTHRRIELLAALADGDSLRTAAQKMGVEKSTVETRVAELRAMVEVSSTRDLARWWRNVRHHYVAWVEEQAGGAPEKPPV